VTQRRFQGRLDRLRSYLEGVATALNERVKNKTMSLFEHLVNGMFHRQQQLAASNVFQRTTPRCWIGNVSTTNKHAACNTIEVAVVRENIILLFA